MMIIYPKIINRFLFLMDVDCFLSEMLAGYSYVSRSISALKGVILRLQIRALREFNEA
jgi:hypothetical protein